MGYKVLDKDDDDGLFLKKLFADRPAPNIIKTAAVTSDSRTKNDVDYALVIDSEFGREYKYPCMDAGNAIVSSLYLAEYGQELTPEQQKTAAAKIKISLESFGFVVPEDLTKTASIELGYSDVADNMALEKLFGLSTDSTVEMLEDAFDGASPRGKRRIMWQVKEAGVDMSKLASGMIDYGRTEYGSDFKASLDLRKLAILDSRATNRLDRLGKVASVTSPDDMANKLQQFDTEFEITHLYNRAFPDPYASVFGTEVAKVATLSSESDYVSCGDHGDISSERIVSFAEADLDRVKDTYGEAFAEQFSDNPVTVLDSLPLDHKNVIGKMVLEG